MASKRDQHLQRYFDGELRSRQARKFRERLESDPADQQRMASLRTMRSWLNQVSEEVAEQADFDRLWGKVEAGIAEKPALSWTERIRLWSGRYALIAATAAAALVLSFFLLRPSWEAPAPNDCQIESLEADPQAMSTIFTIEDADETDKTTVIWVNENPDESDETDETDEGDPP